MRKSCFCQLRTYELGFLAVFVTGILLSRLLPLFSGVSWMRNCFSDKGREVGGPLLSLVETYPPERELLQVVDVLSEPGSDYSCRVNAHHFRLACDRALCRLFAQSRWGSPAFSPGMRMTIPFSRLTCPSLGVFTYAFNVRFLRKFPH